MNWKSNRGGCTTVEGHDHPQNHSHSHHQDHSHNHHHPHKHRQQVVNRLAKIEGHVRAIKEMTKEGRDCPDLLLQIAAVRKALDNAAKLILKDHLESCVVDAARHGNEELVLLELNKALDQYIR
jgi:DNA-binding FrmR family transcriptional regulator